MRTTIDPAGRVVIPKAMRDELGLTGGEELELRLLDGRIEIDVPERAVRLEDRDGVLVAVPETPGRPLTAELVRDTLERLRR